MIVMIGDVEVPARVDRHVGRVAQQRGRRGNVVAVEALSAGAGDGRDDAVDHAPDGVVVEVGDVQRARRVELDAPRAIDLRRARGAAVSRVTGDTRPHERVDRSAAVHDADAVVVRIGDDQVAGRVLERLVGSDAGGGGRPAVAAERACARARDRLDEPGAAVDAPDTRVAVVRHEQPTGSVARDAHDLTELGIQGRAAVAAELVHVVAGERLEVARRVDRAHAMRAVLCEDDAPVRGQRHPSRRREGAQGGGAVGRERYGAAAGDRGDGARDEVEPADGAVPLLDD